jgi:endonuclease/exonuclease/phosphatase (EEP) superfamily protein YafD
VRSVKNACVQTQAREPLVRTPKATLITQYKITGMPDKTLLVVNIHAINFVDDKYFFRQLQRLQSIIKQHQGPVLFAGDFNTWNEARFAKLQQLVTKRLGMQEIPIPPETRQTSLGLVVDHAFVRGLTYSSVIDLSQTIHSSNHEPLSFTVRIPNA